MAEENQKEIQQKFMEYQMLEQQMKQLQEQLQKLEQQGQEVENVKQAIEDIAKAKPGEEVLVPVSGGIFFKAQMKDGGQFLVNVGSGVVVEKDCEGTLGLINNQAKELDKYKDQITGEIAKQLAKHQGIEAELKKLIED
jgi:prefoldin alpha subunit